MTNDASDKEGAAWMQAQHEALVSLTRSIKAHIAGMPEADLTQWLEGLRTSFGRLKEHLKQQFAAKEEDEYLAHVREVRPSLAPQIDAIKREHTELQRMAESIGIDLASASADDRLLVGDATARVQRFMAVVGQHEQRESMITLLAFSEDIGSGE